jgi:hypothetical protein
MRVIYVPGIERSVSLSAYVAAVKLAKANADKEFKHGLTTWWPTKGHEIVRQFRRGMHERISDATPYRSRGNWPAK